VKILKKSPRKDEDIHNKKMKAYCYNKKKKLKDIAYDMRMNAGGGCTHFFLLIPFLSMKIRLLPFSKCRVS
jgi:hypothetical protein